MALVINDRVKETSTTEGTGTFNLAGAVTGFDTFVAGIADGNTTYYAIFHQGTTEWEVGLGTVTDATPDTLARTTVLTNSDGNTSQVTFSAGTKDVFCTLPASKAQYLDGSDVPVPAQITFKEGGTNFADSILIGHTTTGTLSNASGNYGFGTGTLDALTSGDRNIGIGYNAGSAVTEGLRNVIVGGYAGDSISTGDENTAIGDYSLSGLSTNNQNTAVGKNALQVATGTGNTAIGKDAGIAVEGGDYNVCLGYLSGDNITTGSGNVAIGKADVSSATGDDQLSISDGEDGTVVWMTGESTGNVEINEVWNPSLSTTGKALVMGF